MKFEELKLSSHLNESIQKLGFTVPTEVQFKSIPSIMEGKDLIAESATGSGKTLAFGCGVVENAIPKQGLQAMILTPTRELAEQVKVSIKELADKKPLTIISVYGGVSINPQIQELKRAEIVVATPGRLLDHMSQRTIDTSKVKILVLDEADRMLDMGFIDDVQKIIKACPVKRQTLFFSATIAPKIKDLANRFMKNPVQVWAEKQVDPSKLKQTYYDLPRKMKLSLLIELLQKEKSGLIMVFSNTRRTTDFIVKNLRINKIDAIAIHGGFSQNKRSQSIELFDKGKFGVLVCTDVAARGLHIENVSHIYNYDIPKDPKDYVHRIGRTARAGEEGKVVNLLCDFDYDNFSRIQREYRDFKIDRSEVPHINAVKIVQVSDRERRPQGRGRNPRRGENRPGSDSRHRTWAGKRDSAFKRRS